MSGGHHHGHHHHAAPAFEADARGIRALKISLVGLGLTAAAQLVVAALTGSAALLSDTMHNFADAATAVPLWAAFSLGRRPANRRYTYGYGRAEDLAGLLVVGVIAVSAVLAAWTSTVRLLDPVAPRNLWAVAAAGLLGAAGNEAVARYRIRVGRDIGSAALVADGAHARTDALSSLGVVAGAGFVAAGFPIADAVVGLFIAALIVRILFSTGGEVLRRVLDAVDPDVVARIEVLAGEVDGVAEVGAVRVRWLGHRLHAEVEVAVDPDATVAEGHAVTEEVRHALLHGVPNLRSALVHADPAAGYGEHHAAVAHHADPFTPARGR